MKILYRLSSIKTASILRGSFFLLALTPLVAIIVAGSSMLQLDSFNQAVISGIFTALGISWVFSYLVADVLFSRMINHIRNFCQQVKQGEYEGFSDLPSQGWDNAEENEFVALMRDMNWMAHLIKKREKELQDTIYELSTAQNELKIKNECLMEMAMTDPLTQLYNRRHFFEHLEQERVRIHRNSRSFALLMLDIDYFKKINDNFGHQAGDDVLKELAVIIKGILRRCDLCARIGGEEFAILLPETNQESALIIAGRIRREVEEHLFYAEKNPLRVTCSLGVVVSNRDTIESVDNLCKYADIALYTAKNNGRNRVYYYESLGAVNEESLQLSNY